jgi:hypothetical protein
MTLLMMICKISSLINDCAALLILYRNALLFLQSTQCSRTFHPRINTNNFSILILIKKEKQFPHIQYKEIQSGEISNITNGLLIYD